MSHKNTQDLRVLKTRRSIMQAFIEMFCEMDYDEITVQELSSRAMINRKTFYAHYESLDDLLSELRHETTQGFIERTRNMRRPQDMDKVTREFFLYSEELGKLGEKLNCSDSGLGQQIQREIMTQTWSKSPNRDILLQNVITAFVAQGTLAVYRQWVSDGKKIPLDDIIDITVKLLYDGISHFA